MEINKPEKYNKDLSKGWEHYMEHLGEEERRVIKQDKLDLERAIDLEDLKKDEFYENQ